MSIPLVGAAPTTSTLPPNIKVDKSFIALAAAGLQVQTTLNRPLLDSLLPNLASCIIFKALVSQYSTSWNNFSPSDPLSLSKCFSLEPPPKERGSNETIPAKVSSFVSSVERNCRALQDKIVTILILVLLAEDDALKQFCSLPSHCFVVLLPLSRHGRRTNMVF